MRCVVCKEPMVVLEEGEVEVDHCVGCGGIWLDGGELELLLDDAGAKDRILFSFEADPGIRGGRRKCPLCSKKMERVWCVRGKKLLIDRCPEHHGLWFDRGELQAVLPHAEFDKERRVARFLEGIFGEKVGDHGGSK